MRVEMSTKMRRLAGWLEPQNGRKFYSFCDIIIYPERHLMIYLFALAIIDSRALRLCQGCYLTGGKKRDLVYNLLIRRKNAGHYFFQLLRTFL